ncbi:MAG: MBL fold metallo-hydrolase [Deltaproteobacteria bacterium]|nr:MBL fold metallo-hydrolase [Deltaproteobacteria bacterium]
MEVFQGLHAFIWQSYPQNCNTYFIDGNKKILIDPGFAQLFSHVETELADLNMTVDNIDVVMATHGHPDHVDAWGLFHKPTLFAMNDEEYEFVDGGHYFDKPDILLGDGELAIGDQMFQVIVTPGHSPGSVCLYWPAAKALFSGDLIFNRNIGRSDLMGGDFELLKESIKKIARIDCEYLLPGHGDILIGKEVIKANFEMVEDFWFNQKKLSFFR